MLTLEPSPDRLRFTFRAGTENYLKLDRPLESHKSASNITHSAITLPQCSACVLHTLQHTNTHSTFSPASNAFPAVLMLNNAPMPVTYWYKVLQTAGWAYTSLQITPLQDCGAEKGGGGVYSRVGLYSEIYINA